MSGIEVTKVNKNEYLQKLNKHIMQYLESNVNGFKSDAYNILQATQEIKEKKITPDNLDSLLLDFRTALDQLNLVRMLGIDSLKINLDKANKSSESEKSFYVCKKEDRTKFMIIPKKNDKNIESHIFKNWKNSTSGILPELTSNISKNITPINNLRTVPGQYV
ncbi:MAG: hypothetical protein GON13_03980 [Nanoarchaeota archaeon]|nr:hypothetical protein [Nanoarchaeota archaeon]